jgi:hypothetical protein
LEFRAHGRVLVRLEGFEPPTCCSGGNRSIHLSYRRTQSKFTTRALERSRREGCCGRSGAGGAACGEMPGSGGLFRPFALVYCLGSRGEAALGPLGEFQVTRKQFAAIVLVVVIVALVSALVAYRMGLRRGQFSPAASQTAGEPASASSGCVDFHDAAAHSGEVGCVAGRVLRVYTSRSGNTFLDFCSDYRSCPFTSVVFSTDKSKFGNLQSLAGRRIEIHGAITIYQQKPEIIIRDPDQIRSAE